MLKGVKMNNESTLKQCVESYHELRALKYRNEKYTKKISVFHNVKHYSVVWLCVCGLNVRFKY